MTGTTVAALVLVALAVLSWPSPSPSPSPSAGATAEPPRGSGRLQLLRRRRPQATPGDADLAELVALGLEAGLPVAGAVALAIGDAASHDRAQPRGRSTPPTGHSEPALPHLLATTLSISDDLGAPVAAAARTAADALREQERSLDRARTLAAGPRASMHLLTILPIVGPGVVFLLGLSPREVYGNAPALTAVVVGLLLTAAGWWSSRRILRRAAAATPLRRPASRA